MAESKKIYTLIILTIVFLIALYLALFAGYKDSGIHLEARSIACMYHQSISVKE